MENEEVLPVSEKEKIGISFDFREDATICMYFTYSSVKYQKVYPFATQPAEAMKIMRDLLLEAGLKREDVEIEYLDPKNG